jgi:hypothetical protein
MLLSRRASIRCGRRPMRRSSLATALLLLVQADASCMSGASSCSGSSGYGWNCNQMVNGYCCCTNTAYNSGKFCSLESDCLGPAAAASPPPPSPSPPPASCTDLDNGATDAYNDGCSARRRAASIAVAHSYCGTSYLGTDGRWNGANSPIGPYEGGAERGYRTPSIALIA